MSKKTLLNEATVRQFMKYANIGGLAQGFVNEMYTKEEEELDEAAHEEDVHAEGMYKEEDEAEMDMEMDAEEADVDMEMDADAEVEVDDTSEASVEALVDALADTISRVTGVEVTAAEDAPPVDDAVDMEMDAEMDMDADAEMDAEMDAEAVLDEEAVIEEAPEAAMDEEAVIEETVRKVTERIAARTRREELAETITNRIMGRLASQK